MKRKSATVHVPPAARPESSLTKRISQRRRARDERIRDARLIRTAKLRGTE